MRDGFAVEHDAGGGEGAQGFLLENTDGAQVGVLTGTDPDKRDTLTFSVDDSQFEVVVDAQGQSVLALKPGETLDYETTPSVTIQVTATDTGGLTKVQAFTITVSDGAAAEKRRPSEDLSGFG
jgi:large repetitive protein